MDLPESPGPADTPAESPSGSGSEGPAAASIEAAVASLAAIEQELDRVQESLDRLDAGTYGTCEVCGTELADDLLANDPSAARCPDHAAGGEPG